LLFPRKRESREFVWASASAGVTGEKDGDDKAPKEGLTLLWCLYENDKNKINKKEVGEKTLTEISVDNFVAFCVISKMSPLMPVFCLFVSCDQRTIIKLKVTL